MVAVQSTSFGVFGFRPKLLQPLNRLEFFTLCVSISGLLQGALTNGLLPASFSAIEARFGVTSLQASFIPALFEFSSLIPLLPLSYIGGRSSQPRILAIGLLVQVLGTLVLLIPHFATVGEPSVMEHLLAHAESYEPGYCTPQFEVKPAKDLGHWISVFYLGVIVMGFGNSALWANSFDYLDKNSSDEDFLIYNAIFAMTAVWGPGLGYLFGWLFLRLPFDDIAKHEDKYSRLTDAQYENLQSSPSFIGAYWLGIAFIALIQFLAAIPIFGFPRELPNAAEIRKSKEVAYSYGAIESKRTGDSFNDMSFKDVYQGVKHLLTNPVYMSLIIASTASAFFITALAMFGPKLAQALFSVSPKVASLYCAVILFPTSVIAVVLSSTLPKLLNFSFKDIFLVCLFGSMVTFLLSFALLFPCSSTNDIDVSDVYIYQGSTCNVTECKCDPLVFKPYCMDERVSLYNPCFYGCVDDNIENCGCFDGDQKKTLVSGNCATKESCSTALFYIFTSVLSVMCFIAFFIYPSITTAIDRVVMPQYRSFGFGIALFMLRLLGTSPAPLVTGLIFDQSCDFKPKMEDSSHSSCVSYSALNQSFGVVAVCCCGFSALVLSLGYSALHFSYSSVADDEKELLVQDKPKKRSIDMGKMLDEIFEN